MKLKSRVLEALGTVYDPELDEPITTLGFVGSVVVDDGSVAVRLRLPTPQCAPNFAFLMAADARDAVRAVQGVGAVSVVLEDHYTGAEINTAVASGSGFGAAFPGETAGELDALRTLFRRKALVARQGRLLDTVEDAAAARLGELQGPDADRCRELRAELGIDASDEAQRRDRLVQLGVVDAPERGEDVVAGHDSTSCAASRSAGSSVLRRSSGGTSTP